MLKNEKDKMVFVEEMDETLANAIRRSVNEIETMAIDEVTFYKNDSALYDEIIAHRMGLIPFRNEKLVAMRDCSCKGKGCNRCTISLKLKASGPATVYSGDLKGNAEVVHDKIPIVILTEGQEIELEAHIRTGKGSQHIKFSPGLVYYRHVAEIDFEKDCDACKEAVEICPQKILEEDKGKLKVKDIYKCDLCEACIEACKKKGKNCINIKPGKEIMFFIESYGSIPAKEIFAKAVVALNDNLEQLQKEIK